MNRIRTALIGLLLLGSGQAAAVGGLVDLNVYDRTEGRRLAVHWHEGRAYVVGKPGNEYQVTLRNRQADDVLTVVSVDGVNVITGQGADPGQSGYILRPRGGMDIQGWRKNLSETAAFYFTALPDSYAARTGRPENVGVIGVAVFRKKVVPPPASIAPSLSRDAASGPASAEQAARSAAAPAAKLGTGHGRREHSPAVQVEFERASAAPAELITLYYDSHANLVARGIVRDTRIGQPLPRPFPGFVPDPA